MCSKLRPVPLGVLRRRQWLELLAHQRRLLGSDLPSSLLAQRLQVLVEDDLVLLLGLQPAVHAMHVLVLLSRLDALAAEGASRLDLAGHVSHLVGEEGVVQLNRVHAHEQCHLVFQIIH